MKKQSDTIKPREKQIEKREIEFSSSVKYVQKIDNGKFVDLPFDLTRTFFFCVPQSSSTSLCFRLR